MFSFKRGGIHPHEHKETGHLAIVTLPPPDIAHVPLVQHLGAPAQAIVKVGDKVKVGTLIGTAQGAVSANIHASVSGTVQKIDTVFDPGGYRKPAVIIQREGDEWEDSVIHDRTLVTTCDLDPNTVLDLIQEGGLVGKGGAAFPTKIKYLVPNSLDVDTLIINGIECEPWLTSDHRLMLERTEEVIMGADLMRRTLGVKLGVIAIEANKPDAIEAISTRIRELGLEAPADYARRHLAGQGTWSRANPERTGWLMVAVCKVKYPQGAEKQLISAIMGREVPSGKLPINVGVIVNNVATVHSAYKIIQKRKPMVERIVTVTGEGVARPGNYKIRIGTLLSEVFAAAGVSVENGGKIIMGGPMMGKATSSQEVPVSKGTSGILILGKKHAQRAETTPCIRCGRCVSVCPMGLEPYFLESLVNIHQDEDAVGRSLRDCIECGSCAWGCPAGRPLVDAIRLGKARFARKT